MVAIPNDDSISSVLFSCIKRLVGKLYAAFGAKLAVVLGYAKCNCYLDFLVAKEYGLVLDLLAEAFGDEGCVLLFRFGEERQEFFAAITGENVVLAEKSADGTRDRLEHGIACGVP